MKTRSLLLAVIPLAVLISGCGNDEKQAPPLVLDTEYSKVAWGYSGDKGPASWGSLDKDMAQCGIGKAQSPIDINTSRARANGPRRIRFDYRPANAEVSNDGHAIEVKSEGWGSLTVDGHEYRLLQFHFHGPSEHALDGAGYALEMHMVHIDDHGALAVLGVMIDRGNEHAAFASVAKGAPATPGQHVTVGALNPSSLLPSSKELFRYSGSLTTPPCTEGVRWLVLREPIHLGDAQIAALTAGVGHNNRPVQPLNGREVAHIGP